ncbi:MAG TPA: dephospho-CoA kinase [Terriglobales bacterium]|nr:dephospho-CoA kinase [Terriglobales bacterium]
MLRVGLTGGMACGKTAVADMLARRGAHVIQADKIAHELMLPGQSVYNEIVAAFGREVLATDGSIDRVRLAQAAFGVEDSGARGQDGATLRPPAPSTKKGGNRIEELNAIVHPAVIRRQEEWMDETGRREPGAIAIVEAALIFEAGVGKRFDKIIVVACNPEQKLKRFALRANLPDDTARAEMERRSAAQLPDDEKVRRADYVIDNSGSLQQTEQQVDRLFAELKREAEQRDLH